MKEFDIAPFALPNCAAGELVFEELRDVSKVVVTFRGPAPAGIGLSYRRRYWPGRRIETADTTNPCGFGWFPTDDWFNGEWQTAAIACVRSGKTAAITFQGLSREVPEAKDYDVAFRRTLGLRLDVPDPEAIRRIAVFTTSPAATSRWRVALDAGRKTPAKKVSFGGYNAAVRSVRRLRRGYELVVDHMVPAHRWCNDDAHVLCELDREKFTISLESALREGPIWFADQGIFVVRAEDRSTFDDYRRSIAGAKTILGRVVERPEQGYGGAYHGQPRPHPIAYCIGCEHARQRFRIEPNGDIVLDGRALAWAKGRDTDRYRNDGHGRWFFGLERWCLAGRFNDPAPVPIYNIHLKRGGVVVEQRSVAAPLERSILGGTPACDETIVALVRFRFRNEGDRPAAAELAVRYSQNSQRTINALSTPDRNDHQVPESPLDPLVVTDGRIIGHHRGEEVLRATWRSSMLATPGGAELKFSQDLRPGESCELLLKIPYVAVDRAEDLSALEALDFDRACGETARFWRDENRRGAAIRSPEANLDALHAAHLTHVQIADPLMPDGSGLVNTSVGTSTYGNFSNEACMIIQELDQRGFHDEARRRLDVYVKYQGTAKLPGNFTDWNGVYYGAGGFEQGNYNQHHGWVLWCMAEHYFLTRDRAWFDGVAASVIAAADWVFRQRRTTMAPLLHSRGWERGFLPAGSLEDVTDFYYWLSTNALTWRGTDAAARALEAVSHPEAARVRSESDAFRRDLVRGFETMRQHAPLVRLRDGRWVPHYPSRLYCRGRDYGWIRETLEGSVYLLISGLYDPTGRAAAWILEDFQDNRYISPPFGYQVPPPDANWYDHGGISIQPNLLAGLMPHLDRDEPEVYLWMFFNAWCACYREETNSMVEHPWPILGYGNAACVKTSDEANAVMWLRYMFVYATHDGLHMGRAIPREWLRDGRVVEAAKVSTCFGEVSVQYLSAAAKGSIVAEVDLALDVKPPKILLRFRHPQKLPIEAATVNGKPWAKVDAVKGDVDLTGLSGKRIVEARYAVPSSSGKGAE